MENEIFSFKDPLLEAKQITERVQRGIESRRQYTSIRRSGSVENIIEELAEQILEKQVETLGKFLDGWQLYCEAWARGDREMKKEALEMLEKVQENLQ